jgi:hypothetical protein
MLQGVTMLQVEATPTIDFLKSSFENPTGWSMARLGARSGPSSMGPENWRWADLADFFAGLGEDLLVAMGIVV